MRWPLKVFGGVMHRTIPLGRNRFGSGLARKTVGPVINSQANCPKSPDSSPSIDIGIIHCQDEMKATVKVGYWNLFSFNLMLKAEAKKPFTLSSKPGDGSYQSFLANEIRYSSFARKFPDCAASPSSSPNPKELSRSASTTCRSWWSCTSRRPLCRLLWRPQPSVQAANLGTGKIRRKTLHIS